MKTNKNMSNKISKKTMGADFTKGILSKIQKEHIQVTPKWCFVVREYLFWVLVVLSVLVGAVSVSVIILHTLQLDLAIAVRASGGIVQYIASFAPYLWLFLLTVFTVLTWYNFKHTKRGYKYSYLLVVSGSVLASIVIGIGLYFGGAAEHPERYAARLSGGYYAGSNEHREQVWNQPGKGLLAGVPLGTLIEDLKIFTLVDFTGKSWTIDAQRLTMEDRAVLSVAPQVAMLGIQESENTFTACTLMPWISRSQRGAMRKQIQGILPSGVEISERNIFEVRNNICDEK